MDNREVMFIIHTPELLAHLASEGMQRAMELYNSHIWMSTILQPPLNLPMSTTPFFHIHLGSPQSNHDVEPSFRNEPNNSAILLDLSQLHGHRPSVLPLTDAKVNHESGSDTKQHELNWPTGDCINTGSKQCGLLPQVFPNTNLAYPYPVNTDTKETEETLEII